MNDNYHLDTAYIAGLFDGEGSLTYKKVQRKKRKTVPTTVGVLVWRFL